MKKALIAVIVALLSPVASGAQESQEVYSFLRLPVSAHVAALGGDKSLAYLENRSLGDLLLAEADATAATLVRNGRPTRVMRIATLDERVMGALLMHYMLETMFAAELLGIDAFDQPAVEEGKFLTRQYLSARVPSTRRQS